ncbi:MAG TPA: hypothetical protein VMF67_14625 [Rhizomicrobium sp.]|nr:hypothetical protein [Rhizomicrobium sp.]
MSIACRPLPHIHEVAIAREFISWVEQADLLGWAESEYAAGHLAPNTNGAHRYFKSYAENDPVVPKLFWAIRRRAVSLFSIADYEDEPQYKCFLGCNTTGGFVHRHADISPPGRLHVRMNIMLSKALAGGEPVIDGEKFDVAERDLWCFFPSIMPHESAPVVGDRKRFVLSIGILVPEGKV